MSVLDALDAALNAEGVAECFTRRKDAADKLNKISFTGDFYLEVPFEAHDGELFTVTLAGSDNHVDTVTLSAGRGIPVWWIEDAMNIALELFPTANPLKDTFVKLFIKLAAKYKKLDQVCATSKRTVEQNGQVEKRAKVAQAEQAGGSSRRLMKSDVLPKFFESRTATNALLTQLRIIGAMNTKAEGFDVQPCEENLYKWHVYLYFDDPHVPLTNDLKEVGEECVTLELQFPGDYPYVPPFVRVVSPLFLSGSGHIMRHGAICMELLTPAGWTPANSIDTVCIQIRAMMIAGRARLDLTPCGLKHKTYTEKGAKLDYTGIVTAHGWHKTKKANVPRTGTTGFKV